MTRTELGVTLSLAPAAVPPTARVIARNEVRAPPAKRALRPIGDETVVVTHRSYSQLAAPFPPLVPPVAIGSDVRSRRTCAGRRGSRSRNAWWRDRSRRPGPTPAPGSRRPPPPPRARPLRGGGGQGRRRSSGCCRGPTGPRGGRRPDSGACRGRWGARAGRCPPPPWGGRPPAAHTPPPTP